MKLTIINYFKYRFMFINNSKYNLYYLFINLNYKVFKDKSVHNGSLLAVIFTILYSMLDNNLIKFLFSFIFYYLFYYSLKLILFKLILFLKVNNYLMINFYNNFII